MKLSSTRRKSSISAHSFFYVGGAIVLASVLCFQLRVWTNDGVAPSAQAPSAQVSRLAADQFTRAVNLFDKDPKSSAALFEKVVAVLPNHARAWGNLGACYLALENFDLAQAALARALHLDATQARVHYNQVFQ